MAKRPLTDEELAVIHAEFPPITPDASLSGLLKAFRDERHRRGLTMATPAATLGVVPTELSKLETGKRANPTYSTLKAYAKAPGKRLVLTLEDEVPG